MKKILKNLFIYFVSFAIVAQSLSPFMVLGVSAKNATDSAELVIPTVTPSLTPTPTITPTPTLVETPIATPSPDSAVTPTPTILPLLEEKIATPSSTPSPTLTINKDSIQSANLTSPIYDNYSAIDPGASTIISSGQKAIVVGDVTIDGIGYFDDDDTTVSVNVLTDGNTHNIYAKWGASLDVFSSEANLDYVNQRYNEVVSSITSSGKKVDSAGLNQLSTSPQFSYFTPTFSPGEKYNVPAGQRVMIVADVKIDGISRYDYSSYTVSINVITDLKAHTVEFPYGGTVQVFTDTATNRYLQDTYAQVVNKILQSDRIIDAKSLDEIDPQLNDVVNIIINPGETFFLQSGKAVVYGDVAIDNVDLNQNLQDFFDDNENTEAVDIINDTRPHNIFAKWGARLIVFNGIANNFYLQSLYIDANNDISAAGKKIDPTSLNQLGIMPKKADFFNLLPGQTYYVPAGQRAMFIGDVIIDGIRYYDSDSDTIAVDVLTDGKTHNIMFPYGAGVMVFTDAATTQYIVNSFINILVQIDGQGMYLDPYSFIEL